MEEIKSFNELTSESKEQKIIKSFEDLKSFLSNEILIQYQFDLPKEFNLTDILMIARNHRYMRNFSKTLSYIKSYDFLRQELQDYFKYTSFPQQNIVFASKPVLKQDSFSFKQVFFSIDEEKSSKIVVDDITDYNLENASIDSLKDVITGFDDNLTEIKSEGVLKNEDLSIISSDKSQPISNIRSSPITPTLVEDSELDKLFKDFKIEEVKQAIIEEKDIESDSKDELLDEAFRILGLGSIKQNLGKSIITKKKREGLLFDEWVKENLDWVQFLIKKLLHIDYLSLKDESHYMDIVRNYSFSDNLSAEIQKLYKDLHIDQNN